MWTRRKRRSRQKRRALGRIWAQQLWRKGGWNSWKPPKIGKYSWKQSLRQVQTGGEEGDNRRGVEEDLTDIRQVRIISNPVQDIFWHLKLLYKFCFPESSPDPEPPFTNKLKCWCSTSDVPSFLSSYKPWHYTIMITSKQDSSTESPLVRFLLVLFKAFSLN